jgi:hypothetical protein
MFLFFDNECESLFKQLYFYYFNQSVERKEFTNIWFFLLIDCKKKKIVCDGFVERYLSVSNSVSIATDTMTEKFLALDFK